MFHKLCDAEQADGGGSQGQANNYMIFKSEQRTMVGGGVKAWRTTPKNLPAAGEIFFRMPKKHAFHRQKLVD